MKKDRSGAPRCESRRREVNCHAALGNLLAQPMMNAMPVVSVSIVIRMNPGPGGQLRSIEVNRSKLIPHAILKPCHSDAGRRRNLPHHLSLEGSEPFASAMPALAGDNADRRPQVR